MSASHTIYDVILRGGQVVDGSLARICWMDDANLIWRGSNGVAADWVGPRNRSVC